MSCCEFVTAETVESDTINYSFAYIYAYRYWVFTHVLSYLIFIWSKRSKRMADFKHLVLVKFKDDVVVEDILKGMEKLVAEMETVKSFVWGKDIESQEMLRQGFTHAFLMTFSSKEDFVAFVSHPNHIEFSNTFSALIDKALLLDFPAVAVKPAAV
ncbi:stress responsive A/B Barrel Domain [Striga asiatica]|uniref:Stress responsive A/B Barrel Domain n=1 Tax=Striga asiatica TaxID=4170 RepID=A0A5A7RE18_STRAF|nr:stress responsive A/B Barrel Domain [Striga asiatica]